jgi:hypothetical protein
VPASSATAERAPAQANAKLSGSVDH